MKASNITKAGFYWYREDAEWNIVHVYARIPGPEWNFTISGIESVFEAKDMTGDFIGPLDAP